MHTDDESCEFGAGSSIYFPDGRAPLRGESGTPRSSCWARSIRPAVPAQRMKTPEAARPGIEQGEQLSRQLTAGQLSMIAIGGAIGTGLFLGSSLAVRIAGPGVIVSYLIGAAIALLFMGALSEMAVAHPTAGSFGVYAELYVNPWAGFVVRYTYWAAQCIAIGGEATAIAIYCQWWFPNTPKWLWMLGFSVALCLRQRAQRRRASAASNIGSR